MFKGLFLALFVALMALSIPLTANAEEPIEVAEVDLTVGVLHLTNNIAKMPTFTKKGPTPTLKPGDSLHGLAVLTMPPQDLFKGKTNASFIHKMELNGKVIAQYDFLMPVKKIKGSDIMPMHFIPAKKGNAGETWTVRFALALAALPAGTHELTVTVESPDIDPPLLSKGTVTYESTGNAGPYVTKAVGIAHKNSKKRTDRAASTTAGTHNITLVNTCKKKKTIVLIEAGTLSSQRFTIKPRKSMQVMTTEDAVIFMNQKPRMKASMIMSGGSIDLCI